MDHAGNAIEINQARLNQAVKMGTHFSVEKFRHMCILAGCDYLPSLPGVGLGKARKFLHTVSNLDIQQVSFFFPYKKQNKLDNMSCFPTQADRVTTQVKKMCGSFGFFFLFYDK